MLVSQVNIASTHLDETPLLLLAKTMNVYNGCKKDGEYFNSKQKQ
jgi:hypothetical protein